MSLVDPNLAEDVIHEALSRGGDFAELFAEDRRSVSASLDDGKVEQVSSGRDRGAGIRVVVGRSTGFAHTTDLSEHGLLEAARTAAAAARSSDSGSQSVALETRDAMSPSEVRQYPEEIAKAQKVELLTRADEAARQVSSNVKQVMAGYGDSRRRVVVANSQGIYSADDRVRTRFVVSVVADDTEGMQTGFESVGFTRGFELFEDIDVSQLAADAATRAVVKLSARPAPMGALPVVIAAGGGGVLFHEACGHGLEADAILKNASVYAGKVGELVASPLVTVVDDGTVANEWGSYAIDDEGHPAQRNVLIRDGVLTDYMWDWLRTHEANHEGTGNGRRETYDVLPMVRMTNTYLENGSDSPDEIVAQTPKGIYIKKLGGGQVNTVTGDFVFGTTEAYLIEDGVVTAPLRDFNLIGNGPQTLRDIDVMGNDFSMGGPGTCGKDGQGVPVGVGQPTLRITSMTIGGTGA